MPPEATCASLTLTAETLTAEIGEEAGSSPGCYPGRLGRESAPLGVLPYALTPERLK